MEGITVLQLTKFCIDACEKGLGEKTILISDDDEGNGFHTLFYGFTTDTKDMKLFASEGMFHDNNNPNEVVTLG